MRPLAIITLSSEIAFSKSATAGDVILTFLILRFRLSILDSTLPSSVLKLQQKVRIFIIIYISRKVFFSDEKIICF